MLKAKNRFTIIELITASTLMMIMFMIIGFVFGSISDSTTRLNDKISEGLKANRFFNLLADDLGASFPVFYLGDNSDGDHVDIGVPGGSDPKINLPGNYTKVASHDGLGFVSNNSHREFIRCVTTHHQNGGLLAYNGNELMSTNFNVDQNDKPVRYVTYNFTGSTPIGGGLHERMIYRRDFPLRPDLRKMDELRGGYSAGSFVKMGKPGDGETNASEAADGDVNQFVLIEGIWEIRIEYLEESQGQGFGDKILMKVTIEFARLDASKPYGDPARYDRFPMGDTDANFIPDYLDHSYTTTILINRNSLAK